MAGRIIGALACLLSAFPFSMLAWLGKDSKKPIHLNNADDAMLQRVIRDVSGYNAAMVRLYRCAALCFLADAAAFALFPLLGVILMIVLLAVGLPLLLRRYRQYIKQYSL